jgi:hypothetical protein
MKQILFKLFFGKPEYNRRLKESAYHAYRVGLRKIWNNERHHDIGFEKILRLFLVSVQIIFPGIHIRNFFGKGGTIKRNTAIEFYVLFKTVLPIIFLATGFYHHLIAVIISGYLLIETIIYVSSLIFVSDMFVRARSYRRNILMLFMNYLEISLSFAVIYAGLGLLGDHLPGDHSYTVIDHIYFSIVTSTTIGYGDIHPVTQLGKMMVCIQALLVVAFIVLFLNFFGSKVETLQNDEE